MAARWTPGLPSVASSQASVTSSTTSALSSSLVSNSHPSKSHAAAAVALPSSSLDQAKLKESSSMTTRARRRREEAVRRLVADVHRRPEMTNARGGGGIAAASTAAGTSTSTAAASQSLLQEQHDWLVASTVATALERGLDRDLHAELVQESKDNSSRIGQVCHEHADAFLQSVGNVVTLVSTHSRQLQRSVHQANEELQTNELDMLQAATWWQHGQSGADRAQGMAQLVKACQDVAVLLERARKQASLGRPRAALDAVDEARQCLTAPAVKGKSSCLLLLTETRSGGIGGAGTGGVTEGGAQDATAVSVESTAPTTASSTGAATSKHDNEPSSSQLVVLRLQETPFGARAIQMLPKIENEVLMGARRGLNRWFLSLRSGGDGAKAGRAVLRKCAHSMAVGGPGQLGLGGHVPPSYVWRAKTADNFCSRLDQNGRVARAVRLGYWFERDASMESERLERLALPGMERRAEAFASAFGWYRCWDDNAPLMVDISEMSVPDAHSSMHGGGGLSGSRHGLSGSRHGLRGSRHGRRTLGFRASAPSKTTMGRELRTSASAGGKTSKDRKRSPWAELLTPPIIFEDAPTRKEDDLKLVELPESVHPVRRAEQAFKLLGRHEEFIQYYEQNRFGDMKIGGGKGDDKKENRSSLSSLTGDDVTVGTDRIFFAKSLPHLCSSVVGFSAVEAALEVGNFGDDDEEDPFRSTSTAEAKSTSDSAARFRDSSTRYERSLVTELGMRLRGRAIGASLAELAQASCLMAAFRSALKIVHPSSTTRRSDKELLAMDVDIVMTALKVAQDEQLKATTRLGLDDRGDPMVVPLSEMKHDKRKAEKGTPPDSEVIGIPFGLTDLRQKPADADQQFEDRRYNQGPKDEFYNFSLSVPQVVRAVHARCIACAAFALSQEELGQVFSQKKGSSGTASYVLDCAEACVSVAAVGMQDNENALEEGSVEKAVQTMANIHALQHSLPRLFGTLMRGMCHVGMVRADQLEETFQYAEATLKGADKACDAQVGSCYSLVYEICRNKIDAHLNYALDGFQWVAKSAREMPNAYCEGLIGYMRSVFGSLGVMDEGSRAGLHFSCCGHVAERLVKILADRPASEGQSSSDDLLSPITRIDAYGIKNMALDVQEFEAFCESTGVPQLKECFNELKCLTAAMLDRELPSLLQPRNAAQRQRKYPFLSIEKMGNILEKYVGQGLGNQLMGRGGKSTDILLMEKKEVTQLVRLCRSQQK